jgi:non-canonical (house-cleaning) NTP pyrophosphatase
MKKGLGHGHRIGQSGGLDDDGVKPAGAPHQPFDDTDQVATHRAADAAIVHLVDFLVGFHDQIVVDADFTELVDNDRVALAMRVRTGCG